MPVAESRTALQVTAITRNPAPAGLVVGDVILAVNGDWVSSETELATSLKKSRTESEVVLAKGDDAKVETKKVPVGTDGLGVSVQTVKIDLQD